MDRVILADCCEDWIIEWGGYYAAGARFSCPEDGTGWRKAASDTFERADGRAFVRRERTGPEAAFPYLAAKDGHEPNVDRCCAKILLRHGEGMPDGPFACPVCGTRWERGQTSVSSNMNLGLSRNHHCQERMSFEPLNFPVVPDSEENPGPTAAPPPIRPFFP